MPTSHALIGIALCSVVLFARLAFAQLPVYPNGQPICHNHDGGMFGYSVSMVNIGNLTWMAVGKPWDTSVHIYNTPAVSLSVNATTNTYNVTTCVNVNTTASANTSTAAVPGGNATQSCTTGTVSNTTATVQPMPTVNWTFVTMLRDNSTSHDWNGTMTSSALTLFGYDVKWSTDGQWLAIGVPGRSYVQFSSLGSPKLMWSAYHGAVVMYRMVNGQLQYHSELSAQLARTIQYFDRFGSKLLFSPDPTSEFLYIVSNGGWDGVSAPGVSKPNGDPPIFGADMSSGLWPALPTTSTANLGVYIFHYNQLSGFWEPGNNGGFLQAQSSVPLGMLGIDIALSGTNRYDTVLAMRDYVLSDLTKASGVVSLYRYDVTATSYLRIATINSADLNSTSTWQQEDWFGYGLSLIFDQNVNAGVLHVGAPRFGQQVYSLVSTRWGIWDTWLPGNYLHNPTKQVRTFYGGTITNSPDSSVLLVSDATSNTGGGTVYMYRRRKAGEVVVGYESVVRALNMNGLFIYDLLGTFIKSANVSSVYAQDHFGKATAMKGNIAVITAPAEDCVYTFALPAAYVPPGFVPPNNLPNNTIAVVPPPNNAAPGNVSKDNTTLYAIIGSVAGFLLIVPLTIYLVMRSHKKKLLRQLAAQAKFPTSGQ
ncbi:hypothetical protein RI367_002295 [Sorochytrium milnesiophthora]